MGTGPGTGHHAAGHAGGSLDGAGPAGQGARRRRQPSLPARHRPWVRGKAGGPRRHPREACGERDGEACAPSAGPGRVRLRGAVGGHPAEPDPSYVATRTAGPTDQAGQGRPWRRAFRVQEARRRVAHPPEEKHLRPGPARRKPAALPVPALGVQAPVRELGCRREHRSRRLPRLPTGQGDHVGALRGIRHGVL